jgi:hypothetical protein
MTFADFVKVLLAALLFGPCVRAEAQEGGGATQPALTSTSQPTQPADAAVPRLEIHPTEFDFGAVWQGAEVECAFVVKNVGAAPLLLYVGSSCGCTPATKPQSPLAPGESSRFTISYDTGRLGVARQSVTVDTNDPAREKVTIDVRGSVKPLYVATPADRVTFTELSADSVESQTLKIESKYEQPLHLKLRAGQDCGRFQAALIETKPGAEYELKVTTRPPLEVGWNNGVIRVDSGLDKMAPLAFVASAQVASRVEIIPARLFVPLDVAKPTRHVLRVQYRADQPLKVTGVSASMKSIHCEIEPGEGTPTGRHMMYSEVRVMVPGYQDIPPNGATIEILTDDPAPEFQKLVVPVARGMMKVRGRR